MKPKAAAMFIVAGLAAAGAGWFAGRSHPAPAPDPAPEATTAVPVPIVASAIPPEPAETAPVATVPPVKQPKVVRKPAARTISPAQNRLVEIAQSGPAPAPEPPPRPAPAAAPPQTLVPAPDPEPEPPKILKPDKEIPAPPAAAPRTLTIPAGTLVAVRLREGLSSERNAEGDAFHATLDQALVVDGLVIAEKGSLQRGRVVSLTRAGKVKGKASLGIELAELSTSDGQRAQVRTETFLHQAASDRNKDAAKAGVAAGIGAAIGAMAGGGKGAAIGAAAGGAAGAGVVLATRGPAAELESETRITFRLKEPVTLTERLK